jgi:hypothetical protein
MNPGVPPLSILQIMFPRMLAYDLIQLTATQVQIQLTAAQVQIQLTAAQVQIQLSPAQVQI